ncbi:phenylalanine--tRNA ligase subunit beta [Candidatus Uhrbacteria bacterium]|nr:phenylalanine--tRNA ligase subunit beta [Candidatus Uhrbacteria bacterium]
MNLLAPYGWIKEFVSTRLSPEEFAARLSLSGPSVERIHWPGRGLEKMMVGEVIRVSQHPLADRLRIAETRVGKQILQIVCGGSNLKEGMKVAVALVGSRLRWHGQGDLVELQPAEIRGVKSEGMISAANEIGLFEYFPSSEGEILDLSFLNAAAGTPLAKALELEEAIFDVEVTTNRPDAFSMVGLGREAAAILGAPFLWREEKRKEKTSSIEKRKELRIDIAIAAPKLCHRYQAAVVDGVTVEPSPWWMRQRLIAAGLRPVSNIVDITNYVMLELGQPMHAFDADRLMKGENRKQKTENSWEMVVRMAEAGEKLKALDGNTYELDLSMLVIADAKRPIAVAGVMGGENTGVGRETKRVIFESAAFDPVSVRRTSRALRLSSDSSLRFEKGLSPEATAAALRRGVELAETIAGGRRASPDFDRRSSPYRPRVLAWNPEESRRLIGLSLPTARMKLLLGSLGFSARGSGKNFRVTVPYWRDRDIESGRDFTEEIARLHGYHKLPSVIPSGSLPARATEEHLRQEDQIKDALSGAGLTEVYAYSFCNPELLTKILWPEPEPLRLQNPLTQDFAVMRTTLVGSLLEMVAANQNLQSEGAIFEVANVYLPRLNDLPLEVPMVAAALWGASPQGQLFRQARGLLQFLNQRFRSSMAVAPARRKIGTEPSLMHPGRAAVLCAGDREIGLLGEIHPAILASFGLTSAVAIFQFNLEDFMAATAGPTLAPLSLFPPVRRDISLMTPRKTTYEELTKVMRKASALLTDFELFDEYEGQGIAEGKKSLAFHLTFADPSRTLTREEVDDAFRHLVEALQNQLKVEARLQ